MPRFLRTSTTCPPADSAARWIDLAERILVCGRTVRDDLKRHLNQSELTEPEFSLLWICASAPSAGMSQNELAGRLAVSPPQVSALVEQLRRKRLLDGRRAEDDRRRQLWRLAPAGEAVLQAVVAEMAAWAARLDESLGADQSAELQRMVDRLVHAVAHPAASATAGTAVARPTDTERGQHESRQRGAA